MDKCLTGHSRVHHAFYIILLDNFMGPILKKAAQKKKKASELNAVHSNSDCPPPPPPFSLPYDLPQLGLFYADLPGERMGTAAGL